MNKTPFHSFDQHARFIALNIVRHVDRSLDPITIPGYKKIKNGERVGKFVTEANLQSLYFKTLPTITKIEPERKRAYEIQDSESYMRYLLSNALIKRQKLIPNINALFHSASIHVNYEGMDWIGIVNSVDPRANKKASIVYVSLKWKDFTCIPLDSERLTIQHFAFMLLPVEYQERLMNGTPIHEVFSPILMNKMRNLGFVVSKKPNLNVFNFETHLFREFDLVSKKVKWNQAQSVMTWTKIIGVRNNKRNGRRPLQCLIKPDMDILLGLRLVHKSLMNTEEFISMFFFKPYRKKVKWTRNIKNSLKCDHRAKIVEENEKAWSILVLPEFEMNSFCSYKPYLYGDIKEDAGFHGKVPLKAVSPNPHQPVLTVSMHPETCLLDASEAYSYKADKRTYQICSQGYQAFIPVMYNQVSLEFRVRVLEYIRSLHGHAHKLPKSLLRVSCLNGFVNHKDKTPEFRKWLSILRKEPKFASHTDKERFEAFLVYCEGRRNESNNHIWDLSEKIKPVRNLAYNESLTKHAASESSKRYGSEEVHKEIRRRIGIHKPSPSSKGEVNLRFDGSYQTTINGVKYSTFEPFETIVVRFGVRERERGLTQRFRENCNETDRSFQCMVSALKHLKKNFIAVNLNAPKDSQWHVVVNYNEMPEDIKTVRKQVPFGKEISERMGWTPAVTDLDLEELSKLVSLKPDSKSCVAIIYEFSNWATEKRKRNPYKNQP